MPSGTKITREMEEQVKRYLRNGKSNYWIKKKLGISDAPIKRIIREGTLPKRDQTRNKDIPLELAMEWDKLTEGIRRRYGRK